MANWCENKLAVKGNSEELVKLIEEHVVDDELDYRTFSMNRRLFGENHFDTDKILDEGMDEITFWFATKWGSSPAEVVCNKIIDTYPGLDARLSFFSVEGGFYGTYYNKHRYYVELNDENIVDFLQFGEEEGFLIRNEYDEYEFAHDVPTFRLI